MILQVLGIATIVYSISLYEDLMIYKGKESVFKGITQPNLFYFRNIRTVMIACIALDIMSIFVFVFEGIRIMTHADTVWMILLTFVYIIANAWKDYILLREDRRRKDEKIKDYGLFYMLFILYVVYLWSK